MNISKNKLLHIIFIFITLASLTIVISCSSEEEIVVPKEENEQTVIMFFPWSSNLLPYFQQNIKDFSKSIKRLTKCTSHGLFSYNAKYCGSHGIKV